MPTDPNSARLHADETTTFAGFDEATSFERPPDDDAATAFAREPEPLSPGGATKIEERGRLIDGRYERTEQLLGGSESECALGRDILEPGRRVFIKTFRVHRMTKKYVEKRCEIHERLRALDHPNCLQMLAFEYPDPMGRLVEVYEYLDGEDLSTTLERSSAPPDDTFIRSALEQIAAGVNAFHTVVKSAHRDVKPDNIRVTTRNGATCFVLCDYGSATTVDRGGVTTFEGTRYYAPPEAWRRSHIKDELLKMADWWGVGRIVQEMADGRSIRTLIGEHADGAIAEGDDAIRPIFDTIMLDQERDRYRVRPGMVEWSKNEYWRKPLRGLLTARREYRWGYAQVKAWLQDEFTDDAYDVDLGGELFSFRDKEYEIAEAAQLLASSENWDEAVREVIEGTGLVKFARDRKQIAMIGELDRVVEMYRSLIRFGHAIADDLTVALSLAAIGRSKKLPVIIRGQTLGVETVARYAADGRNDALAALAAPVFLDRLGEASQAQYAEIAPLVARLAGIEMKLVSFGEATLELERRRADVARYLFVEERVLRDRVATALETYATSEHAMLATALTQVGRASPDDLAALVYVFASKNGRFRLITRATQEMGDVRAIERTDRIVRRGFALRALVPLMTIADRFRQPAVVALAALAAGLGWTVVAYSPLWTPAHLVLFTVGAIAVALLLLFATAWLYRRAVGRYANANGAFAGKLPSASARATEAHAAWRAIFAASESQSLSKLLARTNARIRDLRPRHAQLRPIARPLPAVPVAVLCCGVAVMGSIPLAAASIVRAAGMRDAISASALATRLVTAYATGNVRAGERLAKGQALRDLTNVSFARIVRERLARRGKFVGAREERLQFAMPGRSIVGLQFQHGRAEALLVHTPRAALQFEALGITPHADEQEFKN